MGGHAVKERGDGVQGSDGYIPNQCLTVVSVPPPPPVYAPEGVKSCNYLGMCSVAGRVSWLSLPWRERRAELALFNFSCSV